MATKIDNKATVMWVWGTSLARDGKACHLPIVRRRTPIVALRGNVTKEASLKEMPNEESIIQPDGEREVRILERNVDRYDVGVGFVAIILYN